MPIFIRGIGLITDEQWEEMSPSEDATRIPTKNPDRPPLYVGETPILEDAFYDAPTLAKTSWPRFEEFVAKSGRTSTLYTADLCDLRVDLYGYGYPSPDPVRHLTHRIDDDDLDRRTAEEVLEIARLAHKAWAAEGMALAVNCQAGLNRSSFVAGMVLIMDGYTADEAIATIREARSVFCFSNEFFVKFLQVNERMIRASALEDAQ